MSTESSNMPAKHSTLNKTQAAPGSILKKTTTKNKLKVAATKASLARAKAAQAQISTLPQPATNKRKATEEVEEPPVSTYEEAVACYKGRASWDLRGRVTDLDAMVKLNTVRLNDARQSKVGLENLKEEKKARVAELKQKIEELKTRRKEMEEKQLVRVEETKEEHRNKKRKLTETSEQLLKKQEEAEGALTDAKSKAENAKAELSEVELQNTVVRTLEEKIAGNKTVIKQKKAESLAAKESREVLEEKLKKVNEEKAELHEKIEELKAQKQVKK